MDFFPDTLVTRITPLSLPDKVEPLLSAAKKGKVTAFITYQEPKYLRVFNNVADWLPKVFDNFKRCYEQSRKCNVVQTEKIRWDKTSNRLRLVPDKKSKYSDTRLGFLYKNVFIVKANFTFGLREVKPDTQHVYQTTDVPIMVYIMSKTDKKSCTTRRCFIPNDQYRYNIYVFRPHGRYVVPERTRYIILCLQKTTFSLDIAHKSVVVDRALDCRTHTKVEVPKCYALPPPTPLHESRFSLFPEHPQEIQVMMPQEPQEIQVMMPPQVPLPQFFVPQFQVFSELPQEVPLEQVLCQEPQVPLDQVLSQEPLDISEYLNDFCQSLEQPLNLYTGPNVGQKRPFAFNPIKAMDLSVKKIKM